MKTIKRLTVSVVICVLLLSSVFYFSFSASAISDTPLHPDFNPAKLPWSEMPSYVQDIIYMEFQDIYTVRPKVPFVFINTQGSIVNIFVGTNLALGRRSTNGDIRIVSITNQVAYENNACYFASYSINSDGTFSVRTPWAVRVGTAWGNSGYVVYNSSSITSATNYDFYLYGGNMIKGVDGSFLSSISVDINKNTTPSDYVNVYQRPLGFIEGVYFPHQDEVPMYFKDFDIPTKEQLEEQTQKGIWNSIKELPSKIADSIGGFFENLKNYLLYFQATEPEHVNPFAGILDSIQGFFDEQIGDTQDFKDSLNETLDKVSSYIETGSSVINKLLSGVPLLNAFVIFFLVFAVIRKVVGR